MRVFRRPKKISEKLCSVNGPEGLVSFLLKRSSQRRTVAIMVNEQAKVTVSAPLYSTEKFIRTFIQEKTPWIVRKVREAEKNKAFVEQKKFDHGYEFLFLGNKCRLDVEESDVGVSTRGKIQFDGKKWEVLIPAQLTGEQRQAHIKKKLTQWYQVQAKEILGGRIFYYSRIIGVEPKKIAVRTQKRVWGNCDYNTKTIHLNWQIILSPMDVIDYVVVHELCHLIEPNHSKRFWHEVQKILPDYPKRKAWLKKNHYEMILP